MTQMTMRPLEQRAGESDESTTRMQQAAYILYLIKCVARQNPATKAMFPMPDEVLLEFLFNKRELLGTVSRLLLNNERSKAIQAIERLLQEIIDEYYLVCQSRNALPL